MTAILPDARTIVEVRREQLDHPRTRWECHRCRGWFPTEMAWSVTAMAADRSFVIIVCPGCAPSYENAPRVNIDLAALDRAGHPSFRGGPVDHLARIARSVARRRERPSVPALALRQSDIRRIAVELERTPADVYETLRASGVLAVDDDVSSSGERSFRIVAADSYDHMRELLELVCWEDERVHLVGAVGDLTEAMELIAEAGADVLLVDEGLCGPDLREAVALMRANVPDDVRIVLSCSEPSKTISADASAPWDAVVARDSLVSAIDLIADIAIAERN